MERGTESGVERGVVRSRYEKGPEPRCWPAFAEFDSIADLTPGKSIIAQLVRKNRSLLACAVLMSICQFVGSALIPWAFGIFLDSGIEAGLTAALVPSTLLFCGVLLLRALAALTEVTFILPWLRAASAAALSMFMRVAGVRGGGKTRKQSGEIVAAIESDTQKIGNLLLAFTTIPGALVASIIMVVLMLRVSISLGLAIAIGLPLVLLGMSSVVNPLQERLEVVREEKGKLTTLASDAVSGLRVMRGVGGEDEYNARYMRQSELLRDSNIRSGWFQALLSGMSTAVPPIFTAGIVGAGLWYMWSGYITLGELVSFYGYISYLMVPITVAGNFFISLADAKVGAKRIENVLTIEPIVAQSPHSQLHPDSAAGFEASEDWERVSLRDGATGVTLYPGNFTAFVCSDPHVSSELIERLARIDDEHNVYACPHVDSSSCESVAGILLADMPLDEVRTNIVLSGAAAQLFQGTLRSNVQGRFDALPSARSVEHQMEDTGDGTGIAHRVYTAQRGAPTDEQLNVAMAIADALDIVALGEGYSQNITERGRSLSGGQRQRVALARAVLTNPPILLLVEPTSAVDSHTESRIVSRLKAARAGKTTGIVTTSPIILGVADEVVLLDTDGTEIVRGTHHELLEDSRYWAIVHRAAGEDTTAGEGDTSQ